MSKVRNFFASLNKSTKITLISCVCFVALTAAILSFFILFPISPNDTVHEKYGREAKASNNTGAAQTVTTQPAENNAYVGSKGTEASPKVTTTNSRRKKNFSITVTTGEGFFSGGRIPTGGTPYEAGGTQNEQPTEPDYPFEYPTDPPTDYPTVPPPVTDDPNPPPVTDDPNPPPVTDDPNPPPVTDDPNPPPVTDDPNPPPVTDPVVDLGNSDPQNW